MASLWSAGQRLFADQMGSKSWPIATRRIIAIGNPSVKRSIAV